jgi:hypothetical protein
MASSGCETGQMPQRRLAWPQQRMDGHQRFLLMMVCLISGCGGHPAPVQKTADASSFCPDGTQEKALTIQRQAHRWCENRVGIVHGPFHVTYENGNRKVQLRLDENRVVGPYRAWHASGRWAVKSEFRNGHATGTTLYRPPRGPPSPCHGKGCQGMASVLDRPYCLADEIAQTFRTHEDGLQECASGQLQAETLKAHAQWRIDLIGRVHDVRIETNDRVSEPQRRCLEKHLSHFRFPVPIGQECRVSMGFEVGFQ